MVTTAKTLLNKYGSPPEEVCLDWAWQLLDVVPTPEADPSSHNFSASQRIDCDAGVACVDWSAVVVAESGDLEFPEPLLSRTSLAELLRDVLSWIDADAALRLDPFAPAVRNFLTERTLTTVPDKAARLANRASKATTLAAKSSSKQPVRSKRKRAKRASAPSWLANPVFKWLIPLAAFGCVAFACFGVLQWLQTPENSSLQNASLGNASTVALAGDEASAEASVDSDAQLALENSREPALETTGSSLPSTTAQDAEATDATGGLSGFADLDALGAGMGASDATLELQSASQSATSGVPVADASDTVEVSDLASGVAANDAANGEATEAPPLNLMESLAEMTKAPEDAESEVAVSGDSELADASSMPAFNVATSPMLQTLKLPRRIPTRARKPVWSFRIETAEGFEIEPTRPLSISEKEIATWRIRLKDAVDSKAPETNVIVQVQQYGTRGSTLKWRIAATADDIPQIAVPLGQAYLDRIQIGLGQFNFQLRSEIERLKSAGRLTGLPPGAKSAFSELRRNYESQLKTSARALELVADANQLEGWLDGWLEVHAEYADLGADADSPPLLQFGTLNKAETAADTADANSEENSAPTSDAAK